jgi:hypothetical protein
MSKFSSLLAVSVGAIAASQGIAEPVVPGFTVETYATNVIDPVRLSFDPSGVLYVGRDNPSRRIYRIGVGGASVEEYGNQAFRDPDAVLFDVAGSISGTPGSVLVGGWSEIEGQGEIDAVLPDESVVTLFGPTPLFLNPTDMAFDSTGRFVFADFDGQQVLVSSGSFPATLFTAPANLRTIAIDSLDQIYTSATDGIIRIHSADGALVNDAFATGLGPDAAITVGQGGPVWGTDVYALANGELLRFDELGNPTVLGTGFGTVWDLAFGPDNGLYLSDFDGQRILRVIPEPATVVLLGWASQVLVRRK